MTKEYKQYLRSLQVQLKEEWAKSSFVGDSIDITIMRNAHAIGQVDVLEKLLETTYEEMVEVTYDNK